MSTLIKKGLVIKTSSPAKYSITPDGCNMAEKLTAASAGDGSVSSSSQAVPFVISTGHATCPTQNKGTPRQSDCVSDDHVQCISSKPPDVLKVRVKRMKNGNSNAHKTEIQNGVSVLKVSLFLAVHGSEMGGTTFTSGVPCVS